MLKTVSTFMTRIDTLEAERKEQHKANTARLNIIIAILGLIIAYIGLVETLRSKTSKNASPFHSENPPSLSAER